MTHVDAQRGYAHLVGIWQWGFPNIRGTFLGGPYNKNYSILGSKLGSPYFGKLPFGFSDACQDLRCGGNWVSGIGFEEFFCFSQNF